MNKSNREEKEAQNNYNLKYKTGYIVGKKAAFGQFSKKVYKACYTLGFEQWWKGGSDRNWVDRCTEALYTSGYKSLCEWQCMSHYVPKDAPGYSLGFKIGVLVGCENGFKAGREAQYES